MAETAEKHRPPIKAQIRLAIARKGVRVQVSTSPEFGGFTGVKIWPNAKGDEERLVELPGGKTASTSFALAPDEDFWVEVSYGGKGESSSFKLRYEHKKPFGFRVAKLINPGKADLTGSVPPIKSPKR